MRADHEALPLENRGYRPAAVARGVEEVALALGIESLLDRSTATLSGGELQRVALGAALAGQPLLILLDEPTSQLDPVAGDELIGLLRRLNEEWGTTVLLIEHRLERCLAAADRVIALVDGAIAWDGDPAGFQEWAGRERAELQTPAARLIAAAGLHPAPVGVKQARAILCDHGLEAEPAGEPGGEAHSRRGVMSRRPGRWRRRARGAEPALEVRGLWHELRAGPAILRGVNLTLAAGERVALMGRNGAGKSTLLRHANGLLSPTRGRLHRAGRVALLLQNPGDYFLHERVGEEAPPDALALVGLDGMADRHPRDLSGGERQRLALAVVLGAGDRPASVVALDEPTRGMDRGSKAELAERLGGLARRGAAVLVATHEVEFAASFAERVVLLAEGRVIADAEAREVLAGGWYFATETARILGGEGGAVRPEQGAELLRRRLRLEVAG